MISSDESTTANFSLASKTTLRITARDSDLIKACANELSNSDPKLERSLVLTPTVRSASYFKACFCSDGRVLFNPQVFPVEFFLMQVFSEDRASIASPDFLTVLISHILSSEKKDRFVLLKAKHAHELSQLFKDMQQSRVPYSVLNDFPERFKDRFSVRSDRELPFLENISKECYFLFTEILEQSKRSNIFFPAEQLHMAWNSALDNTSPSHSFATHGAQGILGKTIHLLGVTSMTQTHFDVFARLRTRSLINIWLPQPPPLTAEPHPIASLLQSFGLSFPSPITLSEPLSDARKSKILKYPDPMTEVRATLRNIRTEIDNGLVDVHTTAILVCDESTYAPLLHQELKTVFSPESYNIALPLSLSGLPLGSLLTLIESFQPSRVSTHSLELLTHPLFLQSYCDTSSLDAATEDLAKVLNFFSRNSRREVSFEELIKSVETQLGEHTPLLKCCKSFLDLVGRYKKSSQKLNFLEWHRRWQENILTPLIMRLQVDSVVRESIENGFELIQSTVQQLHLTQPSPISPTLWSTALSHLIRSVKVQVKGEPLAGLQILSFSEARVLPFDTVFVLGCTDHVFPKPLPKDELFDDSCKILLGLDGWKAFEAREELTLELLRDRVANLTISYSSKDLSERRMPSRILQTWLIAGKAEQFQGSYEIDQVAKESIAALPITPSFVNQNEGTVSDPSLADMRWSATSLKDFLHCPYKFYLKKNRIEDNHWLNPFADDKIDEGQILHKIVEDFFLQVKTGNHLNSGPETYLEMIVKISNTLLAHPKQKGLRTHLNHFSWPKFIKFVTPLLHSRSEMKTEISFQSDLRIPEHNVSLNTSETKEFKIRGTIDSVIICSDKIYLIDFKRQFTPTPADTRLGLDPQLAIYSLALIQDGRNLLNEELKIDQLEKLSLDIGYFSILKGEWNKVFKDKSLENIRDSLSQELGSETSGHARYDVASACRSMLTLLQWRQKKVDSRSRHYADPSNCAICDLDNFCRKNDIRFQSQIESQKDLRFLKQNLSDDITSD